MIWERKEVFMMPKTHPRYPLEFRRQMVELCERGSPWRTAMWSPSSVSYAMSCSTERSSTP